MLPYEAVLDAFRRVDPDVRYCHRGGSPGYVHIHGPLQQFDPRVPHSCWLSVEKYNGTVTTQTKVGERLKFHNRPIDPATGVGISIRKHPLGSSHKLNYGTHTHGLTFDEIKQRWSSLEDFARDMVATCKTLTDW